MKMIDFKVDEQAGESARNTVLQVARQVSATIGHDFFRSVVHHLANALGADCVYIGEFVGGQVEQVSFLAATVDGQDYNNLCFPLAGTAAAEVAYGAERLHSKGVRKLFPDDRWLAGLRAECFIAAPLEDHNGQPIGLIAAVHRKEVEDVRFVKTMLEMFSDRAAEEIIRKQADEALRESEQRYRIFIEENTDAMWRVEFENPIPIDLPEDEQIQLIYRHGYVAECNKAAARLAGFARPESIIGLRFGDLVPLGDQALQAQVREAVRSGHKFAEVQIEGRDRDGKLYCGLRRQTAIIENRMLRRMWVVTRDITDLKLAENALEASERRLTELLESMHYIAVLLDHEGSIQFCNRYLLTYTGWDKEALIGRDWFEVMIPEHERERARDLFEPAAPGSPRHFESPILRRDGSQRLISWDSTCLRNSEGEFAGWAAIGRDVHEDE